MASFLKGIEGTVGFRERKDLYVRSNRNFSGNAKEVFAVLPRIVRHAADYALLIQQVVTERGNGAHVDSAENERAAFLEAFRAAGMISPAGANMIAASSFFGGSSYVLPAHAAPNSSASFCDERRAWKQTLPRSSAVPPESPRAPLRRSHKSQSSACFDPGEPQRPEPDDSCAEQRRRLFIGNSAGRRR